MADIEKVIKGFECCSDVDGKHCYEGKCQYASMPDPCKKQLAKDVLEMLKEQQRIIEQYHKTDGFLAVHGWKWNDNNG